MRALKLKKRYLNYLSIAPLVLLSMIFAFSVLMSGKVGGSSIACSSGSNCQASDVQLISTGCGTGPQRVDTSIDFGCQGDSCTDGPTTGQAGYCGHPHSGIDDLLFAVIRFLSAGVGLIVLASVIIGGIQYTISRGDPNATQAAIKRLVSSVVALLVYIFAYAILNFVVPGGFFNK